MHRVRNEIFTGITTYSSTNFVSQPRDSMVEKEVVRRKVDEAVRGLKKWEGEILRWSVIYSRKLSFGADVDVEVTILESDEILPKPKLPSKLLRRRELPKDKTFILHLVPTGIKALVGGSLGDAMPVNLALSKLGFLVSHPNVYNGGVLNAIDRERMFYVEGRMLDNLAKREILLEPIEFNRLGVVIDCGKNDDWAWSNACNMVDQCMACFGLDVVGIARTKEPVGGKAMISSSGASVGEVRNLDVIFDAAQTLVKAGAEALAVVTFIETPEQLWVKYLAGELANPYGGYEAMISHSLGRYLGLPSAHAPLLSRGEVGWLQSRGVVKNPAVAGDSALPFYLPSVLLGLRSSPRIIAPETRYEAGEALAFNKISVIVCPASTMGGVPMFRAEEMGIAIIGVKQNETVLNVTASTLDMKNVVEVGDYLEALGLVRIVQMNGSGDFSVSVLKSIKEKYSGSFRQVGEEVCRQAGVSPATVLRPLATSRVL